MEATIRINADELDNSFVEHIKKMFPHHEVEINIQPLDDTDYILSNPAYAAELTERIRRIEGGEPTIPVSINDLT